MAALFASGHVVDAILGFMAVEAAWLLLRCRRGRRRVPAMELIFSLLPGLFLLLALRAALRGAGWGWIAACLLASLLTHLLDLRWRWYRVSGSVYSVRR